MATKKTPVKKTTKGAKGTTTKKSTKKAATKKTSKKPDDGLTMKERHAIAAERPIKWNDSRKAVVETLRKLKAYNESSAVTADAIAEKSGVEVKKVKIHCDVYRGNELSHPSRGIVLTTRFEGERQLYYYLSALGKKVKFH